MSLNNSSEFSLFIKFPICRKDVVFERLYLPDTQTVYLLK